MRFQGVSSATGSGALATLGLSALIVCACGGGTGNAVTQQPLAPSEYGSLSALPPAQLMPVAPRTIGGRPDPTNGGGGRVLGTFRNTYYDFPSEADFSGDAVKLMSGTCALIADVPRGFHDAVCVQGSGSLKRGGTVSYAKRNCECAETCPRTGQKICFDALDAKRFPFGRGAAGTAIMPLVTVAADSTVLPMGTTIYIPDFDGVPVPGGEPLDGCFLVEDRGSKVLGDHVDIFTGRPATTKLLNDRVPSNQGVTVVTDAPKCDRLKRK